jgi:hypothetical protein
MLDTDAATSPANVASREDSTAIRIPDDGVLLHIGPSKTGTSALQAALYAARDALATQGVHFGGSSRQELTAARYAATRGTPGKEASKGALRWKAITRDVRGAHGRVVLSSETLAHAGPETVRLIVEEVGGPRVTVVLTLRPVARILPSYWQQRLAGGARIGYEDWLHKVLATDGHGATDGFWFLHRHDDLAARWAEVVGPDRMRLVVAGERDHDMVLRSFERLLGLRTNTLQHVPGAASNRSLTRPEAEALRAFNASFKDAGLDPERHRDLVELGAQRFLKDAPASPDEPRIWTPPWALEAAAAVDASTVIGLRTLDVATLGDLDALATPVPPAPEPTLPPDLVPASVAGRLGMALVTAAGGTRGPGRHAPVAFLLGRAAEPGITAGVSTAGLAAVLVNRVVHAVTAPVGRVIGRIRRRS